MKTASGKKVCQKGTENIFMFFKLFFYSQEGWRLENENPEDKSSPLMFKGVVYNEMKGVFVSTLL